MSALSYATIVSGPRDRLSGFCKSHQMDMALGIPHVSMANVFLSAIEALIHREMFGERHIVVVSGRFASVVATYIADRFGITAEPAESDGDAVILYSEDLNKYRDGSIQVKLGVTREPDIEYFYRFFDQVCKEALNEVLRGVTSQYLSIVAKVIQAPPSSSDSAVCGTQAY